MFPSISEYNQAIQHNGSSSLRSLTDLTFIPSRNLPVRIYSYGSGAYAVVFKAKKDNHEYAIRCFISSEPENVQRYKDIVNYLSKIHTSWVTRIELLENEITANGKSYPIIKMEWISGPLLNAYIDRNLHNNSLLTALQKEIIAVSSSLELSGIGHGDIQCGNIIVTETTNGQPILKLIDYDGMYIPLFRFKRNLERGRSEFQHPGRTNDLFDEKMDRFSFWVILTALEALKWDKTLWKEIMQGGFNSLDNLLFVAEDFRNFNMSPLVKRLQGLNKDSLDFYLNKLGYFCYSSAESIEQPVLFDSKDEGETDSLVSEPPEIKSGTLLITSEPPGATVLTSSLQCLGQTPLHLDAQSYLGKVIVLALGSETKQFLIEKRQELVSVRFSPTLSLGTFNNEVKSDHYASTSNNLKDESPVLDQDLQGVEQPFPEKVCWTANLVPVLFLILIVTGAVFGIRDILKVKKLNYEASTFEAVDSVSEVEIDSLGLVERVEEPVTPAEINPMVLTDDLGMTPKITLERFFTALSEDDCNTAWNLTYNPIWEEKGQAWFCSHESFGAISEIVVSEIEVLDQNENTALIKASYFAADATNGDLCLKQTIAMEKVTFTNGQTQWMIVKLTNLVPPIDCNSQVIDSLTSSRSNFGG